MVSGQNATDKTPMYDMPLIFMFGVWGFGDGKSIFRIGVLGVSVLSLVFCPEIALYWEDAVSTSHHKITKPPSKLSHPDSLLFFILPRTPNLCYYTVFR